MNRFKKIKKGTMEVQLTDLFDEMFNMNIRVDGVFVSGDQLEAMQKLQDRGCKIIPPEGNHFKINLVTDPDYMMHWESNHPQNRQDCTDIYFLSTSGGLSENIRGLVDFGRYYDKLFTQQGRQLPIYEFVTEDISLQEEIKAINEMFSEVLTAARSGEDY